MRIHNLTRLRFVIPLAIIPFAFAALAQDASVTIHVDAGQVLHPISRYLTGACIEDVNHEVYGGIYSQMIFGESFQEPPLVTSYQHVQIENKVSRQWREFSTGTAWAEFDIETNAAFTGAQSQRITFAGGRGAIGIENKGLNRWGMDFMAGRVYRGHLWVRSPKATPLFVCAESANGEQILAEQKLVAWDTQWARVDFTLTPNQSVPRGRFSIKLKAPGTVDIGYAFLEPGEWGLFHHLHDRRDVAEALVSQGVTVLRYGGSMVNSPNYRWKKMIGSRDRRPPHNGTWYPYSTDGWGILDFLDLCEASGFLPVPAFNMDESPQDMADFIEYVNGATDTPWGRRRVEDGHPASYHLTHLELGNEERVDENYWKRFQGLADAIWSKDPGIIPVAGDFAYGEKISDPMNFKGSPSRITSLAAHREILRMAKSRGAEVWFDVHVGTEGPRPDSSLGGAFSFIDALEKLADGARFHVVIFEFNAGNHSQRRALANAIAINAVERDGRLPIATSANCLQPDGQNDNGWDQGLLFLNPSQVWLQPPGYVTRMIAQNYQPLEVKCEAQGSAALDVSAKRSEDGKSLTLQVVNVSAAPINAAVHLDGFIPSQPIAQIQELAGALNATNTASAPVLIQTQSRTWRPDFKNSSAPYMFPPNSFTVIRF